MLHTRRRTHVRLAYALFLTLGAQVGGFAVLVPALAATRALDPGALGATLATVSATSILTLAIAGRIADRTGPRALAIAGAGAFAASLVGLGLLRARVALWPTLALYGIGSGLLDLAANTTGAHVERLHGLRAMVRFHAGFSAAACATALAVSAALAAGATEDAAYLGLGALYLLAATALARARFPPHDDDRHPDADRHAAGDGREPGRSPSPRRLLGTPGVALAVALCTLCFFGDGALESFSALVLRHALGAGVLLAGAGIAAFHGASLAGRLALARLPPRTALVLGGAGTAAGTGLLIWAPVPAAGALGLLVIGLAEAPVIPTTISLAARAAPPGSSGAAVSLVTSVGYSAFVAGPPLVGALGDATSLRAALLPVIASTLAVAAIAWASPGLRGRATVSPQAGRRGDARRAAFRARRAGRRAQRRSRPS